MNAALSQTGLLSLWKNSNWASSTYLDLFKSGTSFWQWWRDWHCDTIFAAAMAQTDDNVWCVLLTHEKLPCIDEDRVHIGRLSPLVPITDKQKLWNCRKCLWSWTAVWMYAGLDFRKSGWAHDVYRTRPCRPPSQNNAIFERIHVRGKQLLKQRPNISDDFNSSICLNKSLLDSTEKLWIVMTENLVKYSKKSSVDRYLQVNLAFKQ